MTLTLSYLTTIFPRANKQTLAAVLGPLNSAMAEFGIDTPQRCAGFVAQCAHESALFTAFVENLNYTSAGLISTWPRKFNSLDFANQYQHNPEKIANYVYANILGNGPNASGDGWKYRGRGMIGITGRGEYADCGHALGKDLVSDPTYLETLEGAARSAGWFWKTRKLNVTADNDDIKRMTYLINGGYLGLYERTQYYVLAKRILLAAPPAPEPVVAPTAQPPPEPVTEVVVTPVVEGPGGIVGLLTAIFRWIIKLFENSLG